MRVARSRRLHLTFKEESKPFSKSIWTRTSIFNIWNYTHLGTESRWGLYWQSTDFDDIHRLFKVPYDELMHILYILSKEMNFSYNDMNQMQFFEILNILDVYKENMEEQKKQNDKENKKMEKQMSSMQNKYNYNDIQKQMNQNMSNYKTPSFTTPNINMNMPKI